jgi:glycosyltransferase involved in cell wall biosynthesis
MRWLQWGERIDLATGTGGVETHARCVDRELKKLGIESVISNRKEDLIDFEWDVVHTHGDAVPFIVPKKSAIRLHTLHGTVLGIMAACKAWTWPTGYYRTLVELNAMATSDVLAAVQPRNWIFSLAKNFNKPSVICWNGWDSDDTSLPELPLPKHVLEIINKIPTFAVYVGRGSDPVKDTPYLKKLWSRRLMDIPLIAAPGAGFEDFPHAVQTGVLSPNQVKSLLKRAGVLVLSSKYEGFPLVVLEALSEGVPVVTNNVGGIQQIDPRVKGLFRVPKGQSKLFADHVRKALLIPKEQKKIDQIANRELLPKWQHVASNYLHAVKKHLKSI